ncbi:MAG: maltose alpha-D-glucosyltransferase [Deltaproteobacteria bacterium]|nr:maltose alpha-D-glucosyltransferase [Deltaproteobacteria bacterium]
MSAGNKKSPLSLPEDPLWFKNVIIYQLHVKAFYDSDGDGVGDFRGLSQKLDYLQDLGVTAIWLLPFCPSPLKDDGYDIADYTSVHPAYGNIRDFRFFLREAHARGLRVITELVINHTSDQHPWFQRARRAKPGSRWRDYYVWSDAPDRYQDARIIFKDFETSNWTWDPVAKAYFWHRFYSHQPDLNFDNPQVRKEIFRLLDFWFGMGVDGLRLDAVPYLFEREGTNCENLPETHGYLKELRAYVDGRYPDRMLLAEANQWPEDAAAYFGNGDECHMNFHFPLMPRLFMALRMEDRYPVIDILDQTPSIPATCQWAIFLRNHDELTLEMVTDRERDYMYRHYAQDPRMRINLGIRRRLAPLLGNHRRRIELMKSLLFSLPGTPILYYGDELGMGDNIYLGDRNGVRTPMQWSADRNGGFSRANSQSLYLPLITDPEYHYETYNVEAQQANRHSLLLWMKKLISVRKRLKAFGHGTIEFLLPENNKILAFIRAYEEQRILVVANLSRFPQYVQLDLGAYQGMRPVEVFGRSEFPVIRDTPYVLSLSQHSFFWFALEAGKEEAEQLRMEQISGTGKPIIVHGEWEGVFEDAPAAVLEGFLLDYVKVRRWFRGKSKNIKSLRLVETVPMPFASCPSRMVFFQVAYEEGEDEAYLLPIAYLPQEGAEEKFPGGGQAAIAFLELPERHEKGWLYDALFSKDFCRGLLELMTHRRALKGRQGVLRAFARKSVRLLAASDEVSVEPRLLGADQSNTSVVFGDSFILKVFRRIEMGINPDLEIGSLLTEIGYPNTPKVRGNLHFRRENGESACVGILHEFIPNQRDAWSYTLDILGDYLERVLTLTPQAQREYPASINILKTRDEEIPREVAGLIAPYREPARLLGQRAAEMHLALASAADKPDFVAETMSPFSQRSLYQSMRNLTISAFQALRRRVRLLPEGIQEEARRILDRYSEIMERFSFVKERRMSARIIRCHGDFHLGQVLHTGKDFIVIDFEGEPSRTLGERRAKRSPLTDAASMIRSFSYAAHSALLQHATIRAEDVPILEPWTEVWYKCVSAVFLRSYLDTAGAASFVPQDKEELGIFLEAFLLEKAIYELGYELNNRPDWTIIPLRGIQNILDDFYHSSDA